MLDCHFPPEREKRSYMMDVSDSDIAAMPDLSGLARMLGDVPPLDTVPEDAWEPWDGASQEPRIGVLMSYLLIPQPDPEAAPNWRTPCNEEHAIVAHLPSREDRAPVIVCPVETAEERAQHRLAPQAPEMLPMRMPGTAAGVFVWLAAPKAVTYGQVVRHCRGEKEGLRLTAAYAERLEAAFAQLMAGREPGRRPFGRHRDRG